MAQKYFSHKSAEERRRGEVKAFKLFGVVSAVGVWRFLYRVHITLHILQIVFYIFVCIVFCYVLIYKMHSLHIFMIDYSIINLPHF